jgi:predicted GNAT family acetyltransferase
MGPVSASAGLIEAIEVYYDAVPRAACTVEHVGPFTVFVGQGPWGYYARPTLGATTSFTATQVGQVRARQRELDVAEELEWQDAVAPSLAAACAEAGMRVHRYRLLVLGDERWVAAPGPVRIVTADDDLTAMLSAQQRGFDGPSSLDPGAVEHMRGRIATGATVAAAGFAGGEPVCVGMHQPVGDVTEIVGVTTLPEHRRVGWAGALTSSLVADARERGVRTVFLSAADDAVARVYERVGFLDAGTVCAAEPVTARDASGPLGRPG